MTDDYAEIAISIGRFHISFGFITAPRNPVKTELKYTRGVWMVIFSKVTR